MIQSLGILDFLKLGESNPIFDVRSPGEFNHAHIPGAKSLPLFTDEERKIVGTAYKEIGKEQAVKIGLDCFGPKMRTMVEEVETLTQSVKPNETKVLVHCWRGGMRSGGVAWLLDLYGFDVYVLKGGYKAFRSWVRDVLARQYNFKVIGGYTGSGKTRLLQELEKRGESTINLEKIASHKGSAFGNLGMPDQPNQEQFENLLATELWQKHEASHIWIEDESQRIGHLNLSQDFWKTLRSSTLIFLDIDFELRLDLIEEEYGCLDKEKMIEAIKRIEKRLGGLEAKSSIEFLKNDNIRESFRILLRYYDKYYLKSLNKRDPSMFVKHDLKLDTLDTTQNSLALLELIKQNK